MKKGELTRASIVATALELSARVGLEGLTIGALAERVQMSKSGVFAHFGSREDLQIAVLKAYEQRFVEDVLLPGLKARRGLARLCAIMERWLERTAVEAASGCLWISGATEYDDRPGAVRDELVAMVRSWQRELSRAAQQALEAGDLRCGTQVAEMVFELYGVVLVLHHDTRLLNNPDSLARARRVFHRILAAYSVPARLEASGCAKTAAPASLPS
jgi:AcrR family transcriptional regulator